MASRSLIAQLLVVVVAFAVMGSAKDWTTGDPCPDTIHTTIPGWEDPFEPDKEPRFLTMASVQSAMLTCPNITALELRLSLLGCSEWPDRWNFDFDLSGRDYFPSAPQTLSLEGYDFHERPWEKVQPPSSGGRGKWDWSRWQYWITSGRARKWFQWQNLPAERRGMTNLDLWLEAMDFSRVRALSFPCHRDDSCMDDAISDVLPSRLPVLESLAVVGAQAASFVSALPPDTLRHVSWLQPGSNQADRYHGVSDSGEGRFDALIRQQGSSLESLEWRTDELFSPGPAKGLSVQQLQLLATSAPNLKSLTLDMGRNGSWPWDELRTMASHPQLTSLTVYMDIASQCRREKVDDFSLTARAACDCIGEAQYQQPLLNTTTGAEVVKFLRDHKVGRDLTHVALRSGDWTPSWDGPLYFPAWVENRRAWFERSSVEPGKEAIRSLDTKIDRSNERSCANVSDASMPDGGQPALGENLISMV